MPVESIDSDFIHEYLKAVEAGVDDRYSINILRIRWNHEEYKIIYKSLMDKTPVWKYYLTKLYTEDDTSTLACKIMDPRHFWEELTITYISTLEY